jgi:pimeloyl-ACP methyl ester carboxylesterase
MEHALARTNPARSSRTLGAVVRGRHLAVEEHGNPDGAPILLLGPAPGSRLLDPDPDVTRAMGVRLLSVDRPGYGLSERLPLGVTPSWSVFADDLAALAAALALPRVRVIGWSTGGVGALALAARHPEILERVGLVGTPAPDTEVAWIPEEYAAFLRSLQSDPANAVDALAAAMPLTVDDALEGLGSGPADDIVLADPTHRGRLHAIVAEALRDGVAGLATDIVATNVVSWGFEVSDVRTPCDLFYGDADGVISLGHGHWFAARVEDSMLHTLPGAGHLAPVTHWREMLAALLAG